MESFLQSKIWKDFQESLGRKVWQVDGNYVIKHNLPFGKSYLYSPRCRGDFLNKVKEIAKKENAIFFKIEPLDFARGKPHFKKSHDLQPRKTLILDITKKDLLENMYSKTRYNIRLAEKKGVKIKKHKKYFEEFWEMLQDTAKRGKFKTHPKEYYKKMLEIPGVELLVAIYKNKIIAANIVMFYDKTAPRLRSGQAIYLHGASDYNYRNLMASFLLQWEQIKEAKKRGCIEYDFWGIDEKKWPGVTRFKKGFGGKEKEYPGAYDLVFQPIWYRIYKITRKIL